MIFKNEKVHVKKLNSFQHFGNILTDSEVLHLNLSELVLLMHLYSEKNSKFNKTSDIFDDFFASKTVFWKKHYWGAPVIDCFEPIFRFLVQFCFQKHRSDTWNRIGMFSELSGHSALYAECTASTWIVKKKKRSHSCWEEFHISKKMRALY